MMKKKILYGVAEIREGRDIASSIFATFDTEEEAYEERERCNWKGDFLYTVVKIKYLYDHNLVVRREYLPLWVPSWGSDWL